MTSFKDIKKALCLKVKLIINKVKKAFSIYLKDYT